MQFVLKSSYLTRVAPHALFAFRTVEILGSGWSPHFTRATLLAKGARVKIKSEKIYIFQRIEITL